MMRSNFGQLANRARRRQRAVRQELQRAARVIAVRLEKRSKSILRAKIYAVPIPKRSSGKPKWKRTNELLQREEGFADGVDVVLRNGSDHAKPRETLGTSKGRPIVSPGVKSVQWQSEAVLAEREATLRERQAAILRGLRQG